MPQAARSKDNKVALLTGASYGIGFHIAHALAKEGINLAIVARSSDKLNALVSDLHEYKVDVKAYVCDLTFTERIESLVDKIMNDFNHIDILINNAGGILIEPYHKKSIEAISYETNLNLLSSMVLARLVLPNMLARKKGHIINLSSIAAISGPAYSEIYSASKAGIINFTKSLNSEYAEDGIISTVIIPTYVSGTGMYERLASHLGKLHMARIIFPPCTTKDITSAVIHTLTNKKQQIIVASLPTKIVLRIAHCFPGIGQWGKKTFRINQIFQELSSINHKEK